MPVLEQVIPGMGSSATGLDFRDSLRTKKHVFGHRCKKDVCLRFLKKLFATFFYILNIKKNF